ncbi:UNVERIFIED_CONTAM: hypothetical protein Q9R58_04170 [Methylobacteriaceae bacterium AG10]|nr:hypothetical protein [Methylobacteriaceae bacterium AG10]
MGDVDTLKGLLERVQAIGPEHSPVLDAHLICALIAPVEAFVSLGPISGVPRICNGKMSDGRDRVWEPWLEWRLTHPTVSVDAALVLMGHALPGWDVHFYHDEGAYVAEMTWPEGTNVGEADYFGIIGRGFTRPVAILCGVIEGRINMILAARRSTLLAQAESPTTSAGA